MPDPTPPAALRALADRLEAFAREARVTAKVAPRRIGTAVADDMLTLVAELRRCWAENERLKGNASNGLEMIGWDEPDVQDIDPVFALELAAVWQSHRIARLQGALQQAGLPSEDMTCPCCNFAYVKADAESVRCEGCCATCHHDGKKWIRGKTCPAALKESTNGG